MRSVKVKRLETLKRIRYIHVQPLPTNSPGLDASPFTLGSHQEALFAGMNEHGARSC